MKADSNVARKTQTPPSTPPAGETRSFAPEAPATPIRVIRHEEFARRLASACDNNPLVPPLHYGRLTWMVNEFDKVGVSISPETVRKWFAGEAKPRPDKLAFIAKLLEVDEAWLSLGQQPDFAPRERRARNSMASGSVNVVAGLIQMNGGHPAFPEEDDTRAEREHIDLYAIIKGAQYAIHVAMGRDMDDGTYRFTIPANYGEVFQMGVMLIGPTSIAMFEIGDEMAKGGSRKGGSIEVTLTKAQIEKAAITDLSKRI